MPNTQENSLIDVAVIPVGNQELIIGIWPFTGLSRHTLFVYQAGEPQRLFEMDADRETVIDGYGGYESFMNRLIFQLDRAAKKILESEVPPEADSPDDIHLKEMEALLKTLKFDGEEFTTEEA